MHIYHMCHIIICTMSHHHRVIACGYARAHSHVHTHACMHAYICTHAYMPRICMRIYACMRGSCLPTSIHAYTRHIRMHIRMHIRGIYACIYEAYTHACIYSHACMACACLPTPLNSKHASTCTRMHAYMHAHELKCTQSKLFTR